ncbi:MAG: Ig-like domain-containing protein [Bacteroidaceae bacterium]|nr:Ig-like domain-containing protein [Bacteroidaceae bacterium]MBQ5713899.1 Ig-like domain-containing protein [Bacteroidaceae bacterium]
MEKQKNIWAKLLLMMVCFLGGCVICGCSGDDEEEFKPGTPQTSVSVSDAVGTWRCIESEDIVAGNTYKDRLVGQKITIKNDGTYTSTSTDIGYSGKYTLDSNTNTFTAQKSNGTKIVFTISINGERMTFTGTDTSTGAKFKYVFIKETSNGNGNTSEGNKNYVDLGLPSGTLWATCNVGASKPEEYGDYFTWGETEPKNDYSWSTYKYCKGTYDTMTKYCYGTGDNKTELEPSDDAATANWGSDWRMPSLEQCEELINNSYTTTTLTTLNGKYGRKITSKSNGNSIFLPAAGFRYDTSLSRAGSFGYYWSRSLNTSYISRAYYLYFDSSYYIYTRDDLRYLGLSVRPVRVMANIAVSNIELSQTELSVKVGATSQLSATVLPENATNKAVVWSSSNTHVATVNETGKVTALTIGTCTIICSASDGSGVKAECKVTVKNVSGSLNGHDYVDLGLPSGTLWASCNVGANSPDEYGNYFAWGETEPKSDYSWSYYKYCKNYSSIMTKYCTNSSHGTVDNKTELEPSDDAATANWGSGWQMPSLKQFKELINSSYTTTTWTTLNGKYGRKITSKSNGNSIFLPAAGWRDDTSLNNAGSSGNYWSRSLDTSGNSSAYYLQFHSSNFLTYYYRYSGRSVRPVRVH